jgi:hypothetical protein
MSRVAPVSGALASIVLNTAMISSRKITGSANCMDRPFFVADGTASSLNRSRTGAA